MFVCTHAVCMWVVCVCAHVHGCACMFVHAHVVSHVRVRVPRSKHAHTRVCRPLGCGCAWVPVPRRKHVCTRVCKPQGVYMCVCARAVHAQVSRVTIHIDTCARPSAVHMVVCVCVCVHAPVLCIRMYTCMCSKGCVCTYGGGAIPSVCTYVHICVHMPGACMDMQVCVPRAAHTCVCACDGAGGGCHEHSAWCCQCPNPSRGS